MEIDESMGEVSLILTYDVLQLSGRHEICHHFVQGLVTGFAQVSVLCNLKLKGIKSVAISRVVSKIWSNLVEEWSLGGFDVFGELLLELCDFGGVHLVEEASDTTVDDGDLFLDGHGHILSLLKQLSQPDATVQQLLSGCVQI